jgi:hypothetical protein
MSVTYGTPKLRFGGFAKHPTKPVVAPDDPVCAVCLSDVTDEDWEAQLVEWPACGHFGHRACLQHISNCPTCRAPLGRPRVPLPAAVAPAAVAPAAVAPAVPMEQSMPDALAAIRIQVTNMIRAAHANGSYEARRPQFERLISDLRHLGVRIITRHLEVRR